jgi:hypothetical protein
MLQTIKAEGKIMKLLQLDIGEKFKFQGKNCVLIPEMKLKCGGWDIIINYLWHVNPKADEYTPPVFQANYLGPNTEVECGNKNQAQTEAEPKIEEAKIPVIANIHQVVYETCSQPCAPELEKEEKK